MSRWTSPMNFFLMTVAVVVPSMATPLPLPLALMMADYSPSFLPANHSFSDLFMTWRDVGLGSSLPSHRRRDLGSSSNLLQLYNAANSHANNLKGLSTKSSSVDPSDPDFQSDFVNAFTGFNSNMDGFSTALADSTSRGSKTPDNGLANYDRTNDLESLLKNVVNMNKNVLSATDLAVENLPVLGPVLGPLVYDLKCLIDKILDALENCGDSIINQLHPLFGDIFAHAVSTTCRSGVMVFGLCI